MIRYTLVCAEAHEFDGWFRNGEDFDRQRKKGIVACPVCNSTKVGKALMAPNVAPSDKQSLAPPQPQATPAATPTPPAVPERQQLAAAPHEARLRAALKQLKEMRDLVTRDAEYVGRRFPEEARRIHYEESEARGIYGEASREEAERLVEEGIEFYPLPVLPDDKN